MNKTYAVCYKNLTGYYKIINVTVGKSKTFCDNFVKVWNRTYPDEPAEVVIKISKNVSISIDKRTKM